MPVEAIRKGSKHSEECAKSKRPAAGTKPKPTVTKPKQILQAQTDSKQDLKQGLLAAPKPQRSRATKAVAGRTASCSKRSTHPKPSSKTSSKLVSELGKPKRRSGRTITALPLRTQLLPRPRGAPPPPSNVRVEDGFNDPGRPACSPALKLIAGATALWLLVYCLTLAAGLHHARTAAGAPRGCKLEFHGEGGKLYANGAEFSVKGANWFGSEAFNGPPGGLDRHSIRWYMRFLRKHEFNAVRLLFNHEDVLNDEVVHSPRQERALFQVRYLDMFLVIAREAARHGLLVMVACHRVSRDAWPGEGLWYDIGRGFPEARVMESWSRVAAALCGQWNVFAADLQNEPHAAGWGKGIPGKEWSRGAEALGNRVLSVCRRWLVMVEGVGYTPGAPGGDDPGAGFWWGENLVGARVAPVQLSDPSKLVYSPHVYGPSVYSQHYFFEPGFPANMPAVWEQHFAFAQGLGTPIVIGEIGGLYRDHDRQWQDWALPYVKQRGFGLFYFALNPDSTDTGGLLLANWSEPGAQSAEAAKLAALRAMPSSSVFELCPACRPADATAGDEEVGGGAEAGEYGGGGTGDAGGADGLGEQGEQGYDDDAAGGGEGSRGAAGWAALLLLLLLAGGAVYAAVACHRRSWRRRRGTLVSTEEDVLDCHVPAHAPESGPGDRALKVGGGGGAQVEEAEAEVEESGEAEASARGVGLGGGGAGAESEAAVDGEVLRDERQPAQSKGAGGTEGWPLRKEEGRPVAAASGAPPATALAATQAVKVGGGGGAARKGCAKSKARAASKAAKDSTNAPACQTSPGAGGAACSAALTVGARVRVHGLVGCTQHNGLKGFVAALAETPSGLRINVACEGGERLRLKPGNLLLLEA